jgi:uncharacterized protein (TIGR02569 family)
MAEADDERGPSLLAVRAFGVRQDRLRRLPGGQGQAWSDGRLVLKPVGFAPEHSWVCEVYAAWDDGDVRVPEPVAPRRFDGVRWSADGWGAHVFVTGRETELPREVALVKEASDAFHRYVADLPRPHFIELRDDPWSFGDRVAWEGAEPAGDAEHLTVIERLRGHLASVKDPAQVIHGDILPNVLLSDGLPPAVIDWPPYFRPAGLARAIAATDAVTFRSAPLSLLDEWRYGEDWSQLLVRALLFRLATTGFFASRNRLTGGLATHLQRAKPVIDAVLCR